MARASLDLIDAMCVTAKAARLIGRATTTRDQETTYVVTLRMPASIDAAHTLRAALKRLWRDFGLRCIGIEERTP